MSVLLDTNVASELMKIQGAQAVLAWLGRQVVQDLYLSSVTIQEICYGIERMPLGRRRNGLAASLIDLRLRRFGGRILPFDDACAQRCGELRAYSDMIGRPAGLADAQIAAIALTRSMTVATRDTADFAPFGVALVNPFEPQAQP